MKKHHSSFNGISEFLFRYYKIEREKHNLQSHEDVNKTMIKYLESENKKIGDWSENAKSIQKDFQSFRKWCKQNLKTK